MVRTFGKEYLKTKSWSCPIKIDQRVEDAKDFNRNYYDGNRL
jgi:hypothetical protein